ncbi:MAG TPA: hypothetical protein VIG77_17005 [Ktedonobacterales bacterium]|jgi:hypothetical protein
MAVTTEHDRARDEAHGRPQASHLFQLRRTFGVIATICVLFVVSTTTAMFLYPGALARLLRRMATSSS